MLDMGGGPWALPIIGGGGRPLLVVLLLLLLLLLWLLLFGVIGRTADLLTPISGDSRLDRESIVRGEALGDGTAAGRYGLWCKLLYGA